MQDDQLDWGIEEDDWLPISSDCRTTTNLASKEELEGVEVLTFYSSRPVVIRDAAENSRNAVLEGQASTPQRADGRLSELGKNWKAKDHMSIPAEN